ncbi:MAG: choice-of-anchor J domain-containing protein, partial [Psychroflexus sp.]|nr:choice-of-anchor J domain-containing protein [Psychroflexus sp.]
MMYTFGYADDAIITGYIDSPCPGADGRTVEIYVDGTVDFTGWNLVRQSNGGGYTTNVDLSSLGSLTDEFVYLTNDEATLDVEFSINSSTHNVIENSVISSNGDDAFQITDVGDVVVDRFGEENVDGTGTAWEHEDTYYYRNDGAIANAGAFDSANWTFGALGALDNLGVCNAASPLSDTVPFGSYTSAVSSFPGESCADPLVITGLPYATTDDTSNYGNNYENGDNPCTGNYLSGDDVVYAFTPANDMEVNISMSNITGLWSSISVLDACLDDTPNCVASESNPSSDDRLLEEVALVGGETYYILISTWAVPDSVGYDLDINEVFCSPPSDIVLDNVDETSADVAWTENGAADEWEILYGESGFDPVNEGTTVSDNDGTLGESLSGLGEGTLYDVYVRAVCDAGGFSDWSSVMMFSTACGVLSDAYAEDFESGAVFPPCWSSIDQGSASEWEVSSDINGGAHSGDYAMRILYDASVAHDDYLIMPGTEVVAGTTDVVSFWVKSRSSTYLEPYEVLLSATDNASDASFDEVLQTETDAPNEWIKLEFDLSAYVGQTVYVAIRATGLNKFALYADDFVFGESASCAAPTDIVLDNVDETSVDVAWTENGAADEWEILYGESGFDPVNEGASVMDTDGDLGETLSGLTAETDYEVYVRALCDTNDESDWAGPEAFTTTAGGGGGIVDSCGQEQISNGFENGTFMEEAGTQNVANDFIVSSNTVNFSVDQIQANILSEGGIETIDITFYEDDAGVPGAEIQTIEDITPTSQVIIGDAFDYDVHEVVLDLTTAIDFAGDGTDVTYWMEISGVPTDAGTRLAWETTTVGGIGSNLVFDNENTTEWTVDPEVDGVFSITGECEYISGCLAPESFAAIDIAEDSVELSWNTIGSETEWTVEYGLEGFTLGSGTEVNVEDTPGVTISGLESVTAYDFYVTANCTSGDSVVVGPINVSTVDAYCPVEFSFVEPITLVEIADISNASSEDTSSPDHEFFLDVVGEVEQGMSYTVAIEGDTGGSYQTAVTLFADWDQNGSMDDAGERYDLGTLENSTGVDGVQLITTITVPEDADLGQTRMRVVKRYSSSGDYPIDSCDPGTSFGQAEDYTLNVSVMTPVTCPAPTAIIVDNIGDTSADVVWTENGAATEWEILYGEAGFDPLTEGISVMDNDGVLGETITGLDAATDYDVYVRAICDGNDESEWEGPTSFATTTLGVNTANFEDFSYYPNPVQDELVLKAAHLISEVDIYNMLGQVMMHQSIEQLDTKLRLSNLAAGTYLMKVKINKSVKTFKLIKE